MSKSIFSLFLTGKKVKLNSDVDLKKVIQILKDDNIDIRQIEDKEKLHSLFFAEFDTHFLPDNIKSENVFDEHEFQEITLKEFLHLIDFNVTETEKDLELADIIKERKSRFASIEVDGILLSLMKKKINSIKYIKETQEMCIDYKTTLYKFDVSFEKYQNFMNQL